MKDPLNPQSQKEITELTMDIGTRAGLSTKTAGMSTLGVFAKGKTKIKLPWIKTDPGEWQLFGKADEWGVQRVSYTIQHGSYKGKTGYHLYDENIKHVGSFKNLLDAQKLVDERLRSISKYGGI